MTFGARYIANIIQFASLQGASKKQLLDIVNKEMIALNDENLRFSSNIYNMVLETALELTQDSYLGLHIGEYLSLSAAGLITQIVQTSQTIEEALQYVVTFANLGCQALPFSLSEKADFWELSLQPRALWEQESIKSVEHTIDAVITFTIKEFHTLTRQKHYPIVVHLTKKRPSSYLEYERVFNCPVRFEQTSNAILLDKKQVAEKIVTSNFHLLSILVKYAQRKVDEIEISHGFVQVVKQTILNITQPKFPTIQQLASNMNIGVRTLQRRLKEEDFTYKKIINDIRKELAVEYLKNKKLTVKEVAYLLNYSETSAFVRSFKRWTGHSPQKYRQKQNT